MPKTKHSARKQVTGGPSRTSRRGGSDDSQERARPRERAAPPPSSSSNSSSEGSDYEDELADLEQPAFVAVRTSTPKPGTHRPTFQPPPPPVQPHGDARHIYLERPLPVGHHVKRFNEVPITSYLKLCRDVDQFTVVSDSQDNRFRTNVQADIFTTIVIPKGLSLHVCIDLEHIRTHRINIRGLLSSLSHLILLLHLHFNMTLTKLPFINSMPHVISASSAP